MRYKNGVTYTFKTGDCIANVRLHNYGEQAIRNFNESWGRELIRAYEEKKIAGNDCKETQII